MQHLNYPHLLDLIVVSYYYLMMMMFVLAVIVIVIVIVVGLGLSWMPCLDCLLLLLLLSGDDNGK